MTTATPSLRVLDEGKHHIVVDKPTNMVVVKGRGAPRPTLLDLVQAHAGDDARPVHRLDRGTSGCCVFAKSTFGQQTLSDAFRRHVVDKRYIAIVHGVPEWKKLAIDARLLRIDAPDQRKGPLAWQTVDDEGQRALTRVRVLATDDSANLSVIEARLETGRMHQIRAHLAHVGFPIVDDTLYANDETPIDRRPAPHAFALHALALSVPLPTGGRTFATAQPPPEFRAIWPGDVDAWLESALASFEKSAESHRAKEAAALAAKPPKPARQSRAAPDGKGGKGTAKKARAEAAERREKKEKKEAAAAPPPKKLRLTDDASKNFGDKRGKRRKGGRQEKSRR